MPVNHPGPRLLFTDMGAWAMPQCSIQHPEQPQRNFVSETNLKVVSSNIAVGHVLDLGETFLCTTYLKEVGLIDQKVSLLGLLYVMTHCQLACEVSLTHTAFVGCRGNGRHDVGIVDEDFVRLANRLQTFALDVYLADERGPFHQSQQTYQLIACGVYGLTERRDFGCERWQPCQHHQQTFHLLQRLVAHILHGRNIILNDRLHHPLYAFSVTFPVRRFPAEWIIALDEVTLEDRQHLQRRSHSPLDLWSLRHFEALDFVA